MPGEGSSTLSASGNSSSDAYGNPRGYAQARSTRYTPRGMTRLEVADEEEVTLLSAREADLLMMSGRGRAVRQQGEEGERGQRLAHPEANGGRQSWPRLSQTKDRAGGGK